MSTDLYDSEDKNLSTWNYAIEQAKKRVAEMKRSIRVFEEMRDSGMEFPVKKERGHGRRNNKGATSKRPVTRSALASVTDPLSPLSDR